MIKTKEVSIHNISGMKKEKPAHDIDVATKKYTLSQLKTEKIAVHLPTKKLWERKKVITRDDFVDSNKMVGSQYTKGSGYAEEGTRAWAWKMLEEGKKVYNDRWTKERRVICTH